MFTNPCFFAGQIFGRDRESAVIALLCTYLAVKFYNSSTWELFCSFLFLYGKIACIMLFFMSNAKGAAYFTVLCFILWLALSHPKYQASSKMIKATSQRELKEMLGLQTD